MTLIRPHLLAFFGVSIDFRIDVLRSAGIDSRTGCRT